MSTVADLGSVDATKAALLRGASGDVLEIGAGWGRNVPVLERASDLTVLEPRPWRRARCRRRMRRHGRRGRVVDGLAEDLPLADASIDTVVCTFVLCSVGDRAGALREIRRVLRPGGHLVFAEHVGAPAGSATRRTQRRLAPVVRAFGGCDPLNDADEVLAEAGLAQLSMHRYTVPGLFAMNVPVVVGRATL